MTLVIGTDGRDLVAPQEANSCQLCAALATAMMEDTIDAGPEARVLLGTARAEIDRDRHLLVAVWATAENTVVPGICKSEQG